MTPRGIRSNCGKPNGRKRPFPSTFTRDLKLQHRRLAFSDGRTETTTNNYGYLWWTTEFEHQGRTVVAHHASGNGGQYSMFIPELDLVVATYAGNYADAGGFYGLRDLVPKHILPALIK